MAEAVCFYVYGFWVKRLDLLRAMMESTPFLS
jgi:hypothetical protein